ncbi:hypothetical protein IscW_ISCW021182 [Ixodes scapularis]|uniref:Uncharacterized protein n=1 Tax=Ixodes scapularis TaxID=6945 RepID=B7Q6G0_IXOSC|nr:hypothetical protein IscW_ISCW021182 [Ixodes scapularis]|eukprot:XP_002402952.1 hypothetical protein IscW_ISCW021182 [Ixodes scapularis]
MMESGAVASKIEAEMVDAPGGQDGGCGGWDGGGGRDRRCEALAELRICVERYHHCLVVDHEE